MDRKAGTHDFPVSPVVKRPCFHCKEHGVIKKKKKSKEKQVYSLHHGAHSQEGEKDMN